MKQVEILKNYANAVAIGAYDYHSPGLFGKHDNVRRFWEDRFTRQVTREFLHPFMADKYSQGGGIRVMDLGCGAGEGFKILTTLSPTPLTLSDRVEYLLTEEDVACYKGVDLSTDMIEKAKSLHPGSRSEFIVADLNDGLPIAEDEAPYDLYFSSYGSLSHLETPALSRLVEQIGDRSSKRTIFIADLLGRFSYEWPGYWGDGTEVGEVRQPYSMSYIYLPHKRHSLEIDRFPITFWTGKAWHRFMEEVTQRQGVEISRFRLCDRSILVGRHLSTGEFNPSAPSLREYVNSLYETDVRTDLSQLIFTYEPQRQHPQLNEFFQGMQNAWNAVVYACLDALGDRPNPHLQLEKLPGVVKAAVEKIQHVVRIAESLHFDDPRANFVEPQLAYLLRDLEWNLQRGLGASHGLLALYELVRRP